jgi:hypothetical protein
VDNIRWGHRCIFCHRPITRGRPTLIFSMGQPLLIGVSHSTCCATKYQHGCFQTCPPYRVSAEQISFLMHFYPLLNSLPGGYEPNRELRWCLAEFLNKYPSSLRNPMPAFRRFVNEHRKWGFEWQYNGDLERDFLLFLGQVQRVAKEKPIDVNAIFRK